MDYRLKFRVEVFFAVNWRVLVRAVHWSDRDVTVRVGKEHRGTTNFHTLRLRIGYQRTVRLLHRHIRLLLLLLLFFTA